MPKKLKKNFSHALRESLKSHYGGVLPSLSSISRDFSLKAPNLPHISTETIRKWLNAESLPHVSRMQVLVSWLGPDLVDDFKSFSSFSDTDIDGSSTAATSELAELASILDEDELESILSVVRLLAQKHKQTVPTSHHLNIGNGHDKATDR